MSWSDILGMGLSAAGVGADVAGAGGAGSAIAGAVTGGLSLLDKSKQAKYPGVTPGQEKASFYSSELARRAMSQTGISANTAGRITQAGRDEALDNVAQANTFSQRLSPLDRNVLFNKLTEKSRTMRNEVMDKLMAYSEGKEYQNLSLGVQAVNSSANIEDKLARDRRVKFEKELESKRAMLEEYKKSMVALNKAFVQPMFDIGKDKKANGSPVDNNGSIIPDIVPTPSLEAPSGNLDPAMYGGDQRAPISAGGSLLDPIVTPEISKATAANPKGGSPRDIVNSLNPIEDLLASFGGI